jgi:hypothetical protein
MIGRHLRGVLDRHGALALVAALLAGLSVGAPLVNARAGPPAALFLALPPGTPEPRLTLTASAQPDGGWRLAIAATDFRFTETCLATAAAIPVGHAHVIVGERKLSSAYTPVAELGKLPPGEHNVRVVLRAQDHRALLGSRGLIQAAITISVPSA